MTLSRSSGPPGTSVSMTLTNFPANTDIQVCVSGFCGDAGTTNASGGLTSGVTLPSWVPKGTYTLTASGGGKSASKSFTVT
jgi:hypothetical protein